MASLLLKNGNQTLALLGYKIFWPTHRKLSMYWLILMMEGSNGKHRETRIRCF